MILLFVSMSFDQTYFSNHTYQGVSFKRFSQYWWSNRFYAILARRFGKNGARLLEIGSGLGHLVGQLEKTFVTSAVDVNPWALQRSLMVATHTAHYRSSAEELPFTDGAFGVVIIKHIVEHLRRPEKAIAELSRVTCPGGILLLSTPNLESLLKPRKGENWIGYRDPTHIALKPPSIWLTLIKESGFQILKVFSDGFWDPPYIRFLPKMVQKIIFGAPGGIQAITGFPFLPLKLGESMIVIARKADSAG